MTKKKIGEIYNKPIVIGNKNLVKEYEIHIDELVNASHGGEDGGRGMKYYDISGSTAEQRHMVIAMAGILGKIPGQGINPIPRLLLENSGAIIPQITYVAILPDAELILEGNVVTIETLLGLLGLPLSSLLEITKEEFYTL